LEILWAVSDFGTFLRRHLINSCLQMTLQKRFALYVMETFCAPCVFSAKQMLTPKILQSSKLYR
jgi:hypothetical protein